MSRRRSCWWGPAGSGARCTTSWSRSTVTGPSSTCSGTSTTRRASTRWSCGSASCSWEHTDELVRLQAGFAIGIGSGEVRRTLDAKLVAAGCMPVTLIHPIATVGTDNHIGKGCILAAGARVTTNITLGRHVDLHVNSTVGHDSILDDFASVYPGATVSGNVHLGEAVTIGTGANVLPGVTIGAGAFVGAGAVVTSDVAAGCDGGGRSGQAATSGTECA